MRVCIYGAGAIGGFIGARLAAAQGCELSAVARGATLAALRTQGWRVRHAEGLLQVPARASDDPAALGPQDLVIVAVKGPAMAAVARGIGPLLGPDTVVLTAMNGLPWWFSATLPPPHDAPFDCIDPGGAIAAVLPLERVLGGVVHASTSTPEPGLVVHRMGQGLIIGEPRGGESARSQAVGALLRGAGFDVTVSAELRRELWYKLWGNLTTNPVSALTGATVDRILADPQLLAFCSTAMREAASLGERIGCSIAQTPEDRHAITRQLGAFKTSMLQDVEAGRAIELDGIVTAVCELARRLDHPTPCIDALLGLTRVFAQGRGLYPAR